MELIERPDKRFLAPVPIRHGLAEPEGEQRVEPHGEQPCPCSAAARRDGDRCFLEIERAHGLVQDANLRHWKWANSSPKGIGSGALLRWPILLRIAYILPAAFDRRLNVLITPADIYVKLSRVMLELKCSCD